jgi:hypothetical protein
MIETFGSLRAAPAAARFDMVSNSAVTSWPYNCCIGDQRPDVGPRKSLMVSSDVVSA